MANLLPATERALVRSERYTRLGVYALAGLLASFLLGGVLLLPSLFVVKNQERVLTQQLDALTRLIELKHGSTAGITLDELRENLDLVEETLTTPSAYDFLIDVVSRLPDGVVLWEYTLVRSTDEVVATLSGRADSREALLAFGDTLRQSGRFGSVDIPVGSLAQSKNVPFSLSLVLAPEHE